MRKMTVLAAVAALSMGAAACGDDDEESASTTPSAPQTQSTPAPTATTPSSGRSAIAIGATEFKFTPADVTTKAGQVTFDLKNNGGAPHALEIEGNGIEEETKVINGGQTAQLKVNLKPGTYEMYCPVGNHRQMGMEGTLKVQ